MFDATLFGRKLLVGKLVIILMNKPPKPPTTTAIHYCQRGKNKRTKTYSCEAAGVPCILLCECSANSLICARIVDDGDDDE